MKKDIQEKLYKTFIMCTRMIEGSIRAPERYAKIMAECKSMGVLRDDGTFKDYNEI